MHGSWGLWEAIQGQRQWVYCPCGDHLGLGMLELWSRMESQIMHAWTHTHTHFLQCEKEVGSRKHWETAIKVLQVLPPTWDECSLFKFKFKEYLKIAGMFLRYVKTETKHKWLPSQIHGQIESVWAAAEVSRTTHEEWNSRGWKQGHCCLCHLTLVQ